jgi:hypothetical protein
MDAVVEGVIRYFNILSNVSGPKGARALSSSGKPLPWIPQWVALFAGVLIQPFFQHYQVTKQWAFDGFEGWAVFALIVSLVIFPAIYRNAFDPTKPVFVQILPIFTAGMGWQSLVSTALKIAAPGAGAGG